MKTKSEIELEKRVAELVQELALSGLKVRACEQTNESLHFDRKKLEAEVARLQEQLSQRSTFHTSEAYLKALDESRGPTADEPKDTLTSVIWPRPGLTPEQFAAFGGMEHETEAARECGHDTNKYWQEKYVEAKRLYELQMRTASEQVASLQKKLEIAGAWKESALSVMNKVDLQEIGKELDLPLGTDIPPNILPGIRALQARLEGARARAAQESQENKRLSDEAIVLRQKIAGVQQVVFGR